MADGEHMAQFWDARAREDANYFVDNRLPYRAGDEQAFWDRGREDLDAFLRIADAPPFGGGETLLEVGCGVGRIVRALAPQVAHVHGIDVSAEMLARARENLAGLANVTLHQGDGTTLRPIADASIDVVVSVVVFQHIPDPNVTLGYVREVGRVLRPGGWAALHVSNDPHVHGADYPRASWLKRALRRAPRGQDDPRWRGSAVDLDDLRAAAADGGMAVEHVGRPGTQYCAVRTRRL